MVILLRVLGLALAGTWFLLFATDEKLIPPDVHKGVAMFKVAKTSGAGKHVQLEPLMTPMIVATRLGGDKIIDTTIVRCDVIERFLALDDKDASIVSVTILKCDGVEYGVEGIDFAMDTK